MNWDDLQVLLAVGRSRTLTEAGRLLGINQTTVTRRIEALEQALGSKVIERDRDGVRLSKRGQAVRDAAEQMEDVVFELQRQVLGGDARLAGSLRVTTTDVITHYHPELFGSFNELYPDVALEVVTGYRQRSLSKREADVAIRWTNHPEAHLFGRKLVRVEYAIYAAKRLVAEHGKRARLDRYPWVAWDKSSGARLTDKWMRKNVPNARIACRYDGAVAMHAAIGAGTGIGFMPRSYGDRSSEVVRLRPTEKSFGYDIWALTHTDLKHSARVRAFLEHAGAYFDVHGRSFAGR